MVTLAPVSTRDVIHLPLREQAAIDMLGYLVDECSKSKRRDNTRQPDLFLVTENRGSPHA